MTSVSCRSNICQPKSFFSALSKFYHLSRSLLAAVRILQNLTTNPKWDMNYFGSYFSMLPWLQHGVLFRESSSTQNRVRTVWHQALGAAIDEVASYLQDTTSVKGTSAQPNLILRAQLADVRDTIIPASYNWSSLRPKITHRFPAEDINVVVYTSDWNRISDRMAAQDWADNCSLTQNAGKGWLLSRNLESPRSVYYGIR